MSNPFDADSGTYQGRIRPTNWTPPNGEFVFCLGHDLPGQVVTLENGDSVALSQMFDASASNLLTTIMHIRPPTTMPTGVSWHVAYGTDNNEYVTIELSPDQRERTLSDLAIPTIIDPATTVFMVLLFLSGPAGLHDVEFPGVYIDSCISALLLDSPVLCCRDPSPDDTNVNADAIISFNLADINGVGLETVDFLIDGILIATMDGVGAINTAFIRAGWSVDVVNIDGSTARYEFTHSTPFESESVVSMTVNAATSIDTSSTSWSFTVADTAGPRLVSAVATGLREVTCTFNEQINPADILPENFTVTLVSDPPAFVPAVIDAVLDDLNVILTIDQVVTPGATYLVTAAGNRDLFLNVIESPYNTAEFMAYTSELTPPTRVLSLYRELPEADRDTDVSGDLKMLCDILDEGLRAATTVVDEWPLVVTDPDTAPEQFLDAILWELGNPFNWLDLAIAKKRLLGRWLLALYALKGSGPGIIAAVRLLLGIEVKIHVYAWGAAPLGEAIVGVDWILGSDDEDDLYTFWVIIPEQLDAATRVAVNRIVDIMKVAHERHILIEPQDVFVPDHWALGYSALGTQTILHP